MEIGCKILEFKNGHKRHQPSIKMIAYNVIHSMDEEYYALEAFMI